MFVLAACLRRHTHAGRGLILFYKKSVGGRFKAGHMVERIWRQTVLDCAEVSKVSENFMKGDNLVLRSGTQVLNAPPVVRFKAKMSTDM